MQLTSFDITFSFHFNENLSQVEMDDLACNNKQVPTVIS